MEEQEETNTLARNYQYELYEICLKQNSIIALDTGSGKTFIALLLMKELGHQIRGLMSQGAKRSVFIVNTVPLVYQQSKYLERHSSFKVGHFEGSSGVDFWTNDQWKEALDSSEVLVMVAQVFCDALEHCHIKLENVNLIVADECHHVNKCHPMREIFRFYSEAKLRGAPDLPLVLGLTACILQGAPAVEKVPELMKDLELSMNATLVTSCFQESVKEFSTHAKEIVVEYSHQSVNANIDDLFNQMVKKVEQKCIADLKSDEKDEQEVICDLLKVTRNLLMTLSELGQYSFRECLKIEEDTLPKLNDSNILKSYLEKYLIPMIRIIDDHPLPDSNFEMCLSSKVKRLLEILGKCPPEPAILIFVQKRNTAKLLCQLLDKASQVCPGLRFLKPKWVVGGDYNQKADISIKQVQKQQETISMFRNGQINTLVSTSVLEEGIDIRACNVVIRFDPIVEYRSYVQSLGRARATPSWFLMMCPDTDLIDTLKKLKKFKDSKKKIITECYGRNSPEEEDIRKSYADQELESFEPYGVDGPKITPLGVLSLLNKYLGQLPNDSFTKVTITAEHKVLEKNKFQVGLKLPILAHTSKTFWSEERSSINLAKREAALLMAQELFKLGCFTEKLLPKRRNASGVDLNKYIEFNSTDEATEHKPGSKQEASVYRRRLCTAFRGGDKYYLNVICFTPTQDSYVDHPVFSNEHRIGILCSKKLKCPAFLLPNYAYGQVKIIVAPQNIEVSQEVLQLASQFHNRVFKRALSLNNDVFQETDDMANILVVPVTARNEIDTCKLKQVSETGLVCPITKAECLAKKMDMNDLVVLETHKQSDALMYVVDVKHDLSPLSPFPYRKKEYSSYAEYYQQVYDVEIKEPNQPLLECKVFPLRRNYLSNLSVKQTIKRYVVHLIPELCDFLAVTSHFWWKIKVMPSIFYRINGMQLEEELLDLMALTPPITIPGDINIEWSRKRTEHLLANGSGNMALVLAKESPLAFDHGMILQSITPTYAGDVFNLERLEVLGDSFLKIHVTRFLFCQEQNLDEGSLTMHRSKIVENFTLCKLAKEKDLPSFCQNLNLDTHIYVVPYGFEVIPEVEETLLKHRIAPVEWVNFKKNVPIEEQELQKAQKNCFNPFSSQAVSDKCVADVVEALIGTMLLSGGEEKAIDFMEWMGMTFVKTELDIPKNALRESADKTQVDMKYKALGLDSLEQTIGYTFKERSFLLEACTHASYQSTEHLTNCYQRLEFLGDAVLDYLMTTYTFAERPNTTPGEMTDIRTYYVNNDTLAKISLKMKLYKHLQHNSETLVKAVDALLMETIMTEQMNQDEDSPHEEFHYSLIKVLGDQVEAIIGAVFCDSHFSLEDAWKVINHMFKDTFLELTDEIPKDPVRLLYEFYPQVEFTKVADDDDKVKSYCVEVPNCPKIRRSSENFRKAKKLVAAAVLDYIRDNNIPKPAFKHGDTLEE